MARNEVLEYTEAQDDKAYRKFLKGGFEPLPEEDEETYDCPIHGTE